MASLPNPATILVSSVLAVGGCGGRVEVSPEQVPHDAASSEAPDSFVPPISDGSSPDGSVDAPPDTADALPESSDDGGSPSDAGQEAEAGPQDASPEADAPDTPDASDAADVSEEVGPVDPLARWLAVHTADEVQFVRVGPGGFGQTVVVPHTWGATEAWTPDGRFAVCGSTGLVVHTLDETGIVSSTLVTDACRDMRWSPTAPIVAVDRHLATRWTVADLRGAVPVSVSFELPEQRCMPTLWAPDGSSFLLQVYGGPLDSYKAGTGYLVRVDTWPPPVFQLYNDNAPTALVCEDECEWSSDSRYVACPGVDEFGTYLPYAVDTWKPTPIAVPAVEPLQTNAEHPPGIHGFAGPEWLLFSHQSSQGGGGFTAYLPDLPAEEVIASGGLANPRRPLVARTLPCESGVQECPHVVRLVPGGPFIPVPVLDSPASGLRWSPDGTWLMTTNGNTSHLLRVEDDGTVSANLSFQYESPWPFFSADSTHFAWTTGTPLPAAANEAFVLRLEDGVQQSVFSGLGKLSSLTWCPQSDCLAAFARDLETSEYSLVVRFFEGETLLPVVSMAMTTAVSTSWQPTSPP
jgi:hypothetical protein